MTPSTPASTDAGALARATLASSKVHSPLTPEQAAKSLHDSWLYQFIQRDGFSIGFGTDRLHAYIRCPKNRWPIAIPETWEGFPIEWHWDVGPTIAATVPLQVHSEVKS